MAKKRTKESVEERERQSRKEILRAQKHAEQLRTVRIAIVVVGVLIALVLIVAVVNEYFIAPNRAVATVNDVSITLREWQDRVRFERAQRLVALNEQLELFGGDVGLIQQFSSQTLVELQNVQGLGEAVLERMIDEEVIRQGAQERGLTPDQADVEQEIAASFNYFGGDSPTPAPSPTATIMPTPSLTPIGADAPSPEQELVEPTAPANEPPPTALPTATPVSEEAFQEELNNFLADFSELGIDRSAYESAVAAALAAERLTETLAEEQALATEDEHVSFYYLTFTDEEEAQAALEEIEAGGFLTTWNTIRSQPAETGDEDPEAPASTASEVLWRTQDALTGSFGEEIAQAAIDLPINTPSELITLTGADGEPLYVIIMVSGREVRDLSAEELESRKQQLLLDYIAENRLGNVETTELWRERVPSLPPLDPLFLQPPTPTPVQPATGIEQSTPDTGAE